MRYLLIPALLLVVSHLSFGQKYSTTSSNVRFFSSAPLEDIEATNTTSRSVVDMETGEFAFIIKIKDFQFEKSLMQEHFNENYLESEKYPDATFAGFIADWSGVKGEQEVIARGNLRVHGISRPVEIKGNIDYQDDQLTITSVFSIQLVDYKIKIPKAVFYNIAEEVEVTIKFDYEPITN
ncbi:MAG: YceI family protein [Cyclobacteriaceae bacterium]